MRIWDHPEFERVAASFREAVRSKDEARIDRWRGELRRLLKENAARKVEIAREAQVFAEKPKRARKRWVAAARHDAAPMTATHAHILRLEDANEPVELVVVSEPFVYRRRKNGEPGTREARYLLNVFVPKAG